MNDINLLYVAIDAVSVTLLVLLAAQLVRQAPDYLVALLVSVVLLGVISYIISSRDDYGVLVDEGYRLDLGALHPLFNILRNATGGAFMLLCHVIFRDTRAWPRTLIALWFVQIFLEEPIHWLLGNNPGSPTMQTLLFEAAPAFLQTVFLGFSLYWMLSSHRADLVASRRRARILIIVVYSLQDQDSDHRRVFPAGGGIARGGTGGIRFRLGPHPMAVPYPRCPHRAGSAPDSGAAHGIHVSGHAFCAWRDTEVIARRPHHTATRPAGRGRRQSPRCVRRRSYLSPAGPYRSRPGSAPGAAGVSPP